MNAVRSSVSKGLLLAMIAMDVLFFARVSGRVLLPVELYGVEELVAAEEALRRAFDEPVVRINFPFLWQCSVFSGLDISRLEHH
jgi:hypothetical protein